jgi:hypothetical protein
VTPHTMLTGSRTLQQTHLTTASYNDALAWQALRDHGRERGRPLQGRKAVVVVAPGGPRPCPACKTTDALPPSDLAWAGSASPGAARASEKHPEEPSKSGPESTNSRKFEYQASPGRPTRRAGQHGGLEVGRGAWFRGECWAPSLFGALLRIPGVVSVQEDRTRLTVRLPREALRAAANLLGFRRPAQAVKILEEAARRRVHRAAPTVRAQRRRAIRGPLNGLASRNPQDGVLRAQYGSDEAVRGLKGAVVKMRPGATCPA